MASMRKRSRLALLLLISAIGVITVALIGIVLSSRVLPQAVGAPQNAATFKVIPTGTAPAPITAAQSGAATTLAPTATNAYSIPTSTSSGVPPRASSTVIDQRVDELIARMSIEEKVGQVFLVYFSGATLSPALLEMINEYHIGGIILFVNAGNIQNVRQVAQLITAAQQEAASHNTKIPLFVAMDQEGGPVVRLPNEATHFPSNMSVAATGSVENARLVAAVTAEELRALGINMNLAPVLDVNDNPSNPVIGVRSFSSSSQVVA